MRGFDQVFPVDQKLSSKTMDSMDTLIHLLDVEQLDPNERDRAYGLTPLMKAAARGYVEAVYCLLQHGADPDLKDNAGFTALHKCWKQHEAVKDILLSHGATVYPWPRKLRFEYNFEGTGESRKWTEMDDLDAPEDLSKEVLLGNPVPPCLK